MTVMLSLTARMRLARLMLVVNPHADDADWPDRIAELVAAGVDFVYLTTPRAGVEAVAYGLDRLANSVAGSGALIAMNRELAAHQPGDADCIITGSSTGLADEALGHRWTLYGQRVHDRHQLSAAARNARVSLLTVGPTFLPRDAATAAPGTRLLRNAAERLPDPAAGPAWFAVGGINERNLDQVFDAGAYRIAVASAILNSRSPERAAARLRERLDELWSSRAELTNLPLKVVGH
ncbi:MAG: hypothetical protein CR980_01165 [Propionibacteriales bacterium]|nr:MAG: hypothetical protein CR980_01165 [Propionibacteriales bacterium]